MPPAWLLRVFTSEPPGKPTLRPLYLFLISQNQGGFHIKRHQSEFLLWARHNAESFTYIISVIMRYYYYLPTCELGYCYLHLPVRKLAL